MTFMQRIPPGRLALRSISLLGSFVEKFAGNPALKEYAKYHKLLANEVAKFYRTFEHEGVDGAAAKIEPLLEQLLSRGRYAKAARDCYAGEGKVVIRLCHDGRTDGYGTSVLVSGKILGDTGGGAEITLGLFGIDEKKAPVTKYIGPLYRQCAELERKGITLCGARVPIHFIFCLDGKAMQQTIGSDPFCCKDQGHPCPLCLIKKSRLLQDNLAADRINDDSISLVQGTFTIKRRFFVDPLHLAIRLYEFFLQTLAEDIGIGGKGEARRTLWKELIADVPGNVRMDPFCTDEAKSNYTLPSRPVAVYEKVIRGFPYEKAFAVEGKKSKLTTHNYRALGSLLINSMKAIKRRDVTPTTTLVFNLTADFIALLPGGSKKWYTHALKHHVIEQMVMFPTALISTSTTEGQQKRQRTLKQNSVFNSGMSQRMGIVRAEMIPVFASMRHPFVIHRRQSAHAQAEAEQYNFTTLGTILPRWTIATVEEMREALPAAFPASFSLVCEDDLLAEAPRTPLPAPAQRRTAPRNDRPPAKKARQSRVAHASAADD